MLRQLLLAAGLLTGLPATAQYNPLWVPDTLRGPNFTLRMAMGMKQFLPGPMTMTAGFNGDFWGPTLLYQLHDTVRLNVVNNLMGDTTTVHWHGFTLPPEMDGGPHQPIPPNTTWRPFYKVKNRAGFFWYHPHLHMMTEEQVTMGLGGFIIVRDSVENALPLPRHYGVDDLPLALTDRRFTAGTNAFALVHYGDTVLTNGVLNAAAPVPAQVVRLRLLDAAPERSYNVGFSDNRPFWVIANDGGMLAAPVQVTRFLLSAGERFELLVDFGGQQGQTVDLVAFNNEIATDVPGSEPVNFPVPVFQNQLGARRFNLLHFTVGAPTANPITSIPATLRPSVFPTAASATNTRRVEMSNALGPNVPPGAGWFDGQFFDMHRIDQQITLGATEIWELGNQSNIAHPFHIHDVQFYLLDRNGQPAPDYEQAWKDVVLVRRSETLHFIARFEQEADSMHPFMYHCHILFHEDAGMMGQFTVHPSPTGLPEPTAESTFAVYPNPVHQRLYFSTTAAARFLAVTITDALGRVVLPAAPLSFERAIDVSALPSGLYIIRMSEANGRSVSRRFVRQ